MRKIIKMITTLFALSLFAAVPMPPSDLQLIAATGCTYPTSLDTFADESDLNDVTTTKYNKLQCAVEKVQAEVGTDGPNDVALDLGDDGTNESAELNKIAIKNDAGGAFTEPDPDKLLIDVGKITPSTFVITSYGAVLDALTVSDGAITSGDATLTSATGMTGITAGMLVEVEGAGASAVVLVTTVASVTSVNSVELSTTASTTVAGAHVGWGTNNAQPLADALNACSTAGGGTVFIPTGVGYVASAWTGSPAVLTVHNCTVTGAGWGSILKWLHPTDGSNGRILRFDSSTKMRFTNFAVDMNNSRRASKISYGLYCIDACEDFEFNDMLAFDSRATAAEVGSAQDRAWVGFGAPVTTHRNISIHDNLVLGQLQTEIHNKVQGCDIHDNIMINTVDSPRTTSAIGVINEVATGGLIENCSIHDNIIEGYENRSIDVKHGGVDFSSTFRRVKVHNNIIKIGISGAGGGNGILVGVGNSGLSYNQPIVFDDIEVYDNQIYADTSSDFALIFFNNNQTNTGFYFERPVIRGNVVSRVSNLNNGANDGISISDGRNGVVSDNRVYGTRFAYRLGVTSSLIANNYGTGIDDAVDSVKTFNCFIVVGGKNEIKDNFCDGEYDDAVFWEATSGVADNRFVGNRVDATATEGVKISTAATGTIIADTWLNGSLTTGISRSAGTSGGRMQIRNTQFGPTQPTTFFSPGTTDVSDTWQLADRTQIGTIADSGDGAAGTLTMIPYYRNLDVTGNDSSGGNELTISEAQAAEGMIIEPCNVGGTNSITMKNSAGVFVTLTGSDTAMAIKTCMVARYIGGAWYQTQ